MAARAMKVPVAMTWAAVALLAGCSERTAPKPAAEQATAQQPARAEGPAVRAGTLRDLSVIARGQPIDADEAAEAAERIAEGAGTIEAFVDAQLADAGFGKRIAGALIFGGPVSVKKLHPVPTHSTIRSMKVDGVRVHFLRKPCKPAEAVDVDPWWDPGEPIKVCPEAYRPDSRGDAEGRTCGSTMLAPYASETCGCGPRLMYCTRDAKLNGRVRSSLLREVRQTLADVAAGDGPIDALFTRNDTIRNRDVEFVYRRARVAAGEDPALLDLEGFDEKPRAAPRHEQVPGQHAGILTSPALIYGSDALRGVMRNYYMYLWCAEPARSKVTTASVMKLGKVDLRVGDGWKQLAAMPICTDCHAKLDYGMQFFRGFPSSVDGIDFRPKDALTGDGPLYGDHIEDRRGEAPLNPQGFARLVLAQDEFGQCLTRRVVDHVFSGEGTAEDFDAVEAVFTRTRNLKQMMRAALLRFAARPPSAPVRSPLVAPPPAAADAPEIAVGAPLRGFLDNHCAECHDAEDAHPFDAPALPRETVAEMLELVAFGAMPATPRGLDEAERRRFVDLTVPLLWGEEADRAAARAFFADAYRAYPVHRFDAAMKLVSAAAGGDKRPGLSVLERAVQQSQARYSPGFAVATGITALSACKGEGLSGDALAECVRKATAPGTVLVGGAPTAP